MFKKLLKQASKALGVVNSPLGIIGQLPKSAQFGLLSDHLLAEKKQHEQHKRKK